MNPNTFKKRVNLVNWLVVKIARLIRPRRVGHAGTLLHRVVS